MVRGQAGWQKRQALQQLQSVREVKSRADPIFSSKEKRRQNWGFPDSIIFKVI
jgi:hypothetical protein